MADITLQIGPVMNLAMASDVGHLLKFAIITVGAGIVVLAITFGNISGVAR